MPFVSTNIEVNTKLIQKLSKKFDLASEFVKIWKFENFRKSVFPLFLKIITFTNSAVKFRVSKMFTPNFFCKLWPKCRYEKCPRT